MLLTLTTTTVKAIGELVKRIPAQEIICSMKQGNRGMIDHLILVPKKHDWTGMTSLSFHSSPLPIRVVGLKGSIGARPMLHV